MKKSIIALIAILTLFVGGITVVFLNDFGAEEESLEGKQVELSLAVEEIIGGKILLTEELVKNQIIIDAVIVSNTSNSALTKSEILQLDQQWIETQGTSDFIQEFLRNDVAHELLHFQQENSGFSEIFITDRIGLNVGQTNKTTDYYQADENWWLDTYNEGKGFSHHGKIEFDDSSQSEAISVYVPIRDPETTEIIGIVKAVVNILEIKLSL